MFDVRGWLMSDCQQNYDLTQVWYCLPVDSVGPAGDSVRECQ